MPPANVEQMTTAIPNAVLLITPSSFNGTITWNVVIDIDHESHFGHGTVSFTNGTYDPQGPLNASLKIINWDWAVVRGIPTFLLLAGKAHEWIGILSSYNSSDIVGLTTPDGAYQGGDFDASGKDFVWSF